MQESKKIAFIGHDSHRATRGIAQQLSFIQGEFPNAVWVTPGITRSEKYIGKWATKHGIPIKILGTRSRIPLGIKRNKDSLGSEESISGFLAPVTCLIVARDSAATMGQGTLSIALHGLAGDRVAEASHWARMNGIQIIDLVD